MQNSSKPLIPVGSLCLWKNNYQRTVVSSSPGYVKFPIRKRSWTGRIHTTYSVNELLAMGCVFLNKKTKFPILKTELTLLYTMKFNPRKELKRELKEANEYSKRSGHKLCPGFKRLKSLVSI